MLDIFPGFVQGMYTVLRILFNKSSHSLSSRVWGRIAVFAGGLEGDSEGQNGYDNSDLTPQNTIAYRTNNYSGVILNI